jgi:polyphosphate kinase
MGFCTKSRHRRFLQGCPEFELYVVDDGILSIEYWLEVSDEEQGRRFEARISDPLRQWKLSPTVLTKQMIRVFASARHDVCSNQHKARALAYCSIGRQTTGALELHQPFARDHSLRKGKAREGGTARSFAEGAYDDLATLDGLQFVPERT